MTYRVRFTMPNGRTGHWMRDYATREDAQRAIDDHQEQYAQAYVVEEVVPTTTEAVPDATPEPATPDARIRELEAELAQLKASHRMVADAYDAARQDRDHALAKVARLEEALAASPRGPAKASEAPGEGQDSGEGEK